ncbi:DUF3800 domain-containing protein [Nostoc sp. FACHB-190]|uniref:DUF3800 domain-containing protein n=1 Tax=Nostoc sp. FACHB-190 TaxID=2692838 RepID=UPI0016898523|nr:DUF3800 domain-containing protein [Nostoc sp. FACHB-190]MBD2302624.1 DUF3800 domain-containing protein [Nostoc sp. FACHB-190]
MLLFYVDESGTCSKDDQTNFFVLASVAISEHDSSQIHTKVLSLKQSIFPSKDHDTWELKGREIYRGEGTFKKHKLESRIRIFLEISTTLNQLPCHIFTVVVNKKAFYKMREDMKDDTMLYRLTFNRLLQELDGFMKCSNESGILLMDSRSTHSSSVQDGRLVKAYRDWINSQKYDCCFVEQPWFGVSQFCLGLQLADYVAYLINLSTQQIEGKSHTVECLKAFDILQSKIHLVEIPPSEIIT